jgi:hypothetical protein
MNISFIAIAWLLAFDAPEFVPSKDAPSNSPPILFDCARQTHLASRTENWISSLAAMASGVLVGRPFASGLDYRTGQEKGSAPEMANQQPKPLIDTAKDASWI